MPKKTIQRDSEYQYLDGFFRDMGYTGGKITSSNPHYLTDCSSLERTEYRIQRINFNGCCGEDTDAGKREKGKRLEICQAYYEKPGLIVEWGKDWPISPVEKDLENKWIFVGFIKKTYWQFLGVYEYVDWHTLSPEQQRLIEYDRRRTNFRVYRLKESVLNLPQEYLPLTGEQIAEIKRQRKQH